MSDQQTADWKEKEENFHTHWSLFLTISMIGSIFLNVSMIYLALPSIASSFQATVEVKWIPLSYLLSFLLIFSIRHQLRKRCSVRRVALIGISLFTIGSMLGGTALVFWQLILSQWIQGMGGWLFLSSLLEWTKKHLQSQEISKQLKMVALVSGVLGLLLGGGLIDWLHWHVIFLINVPLGLTYYYLCLWLLPQGNPQSDASIKTTDSFLTLFLLLFLAIGLSPYGDVKGIPTVLFFIAAIGVGALWLRRKRANDTHSFVFEYPKKDFWFYFFGQFHYALIGSSFLFLLPFFFAKELKKGMLDVGLLLIMLVSILTGVAALRKRFLQAVSEQIFVLISSILLFIGLILCFPLDPTWGYGDLAVRVIVFGIGFGFYPSEPISSSFIDLFDTDFAYRHFQWIGWFLGPVICTLIWTPNMMESLFNRMDLRIVLFMLILLVLGSMIFFLYRTIGERIGKKQMG